MNFKACARRSASSRIRRFKRPPHHSFMCLRKHLSLLKFRCPTTKKWEVTMTTAAKASLCQGLFLSALERQLGCLRAVGPITEAVTTREWKLRTATMKSRKRTQPVSVSFCKVVWLDEMLMQFGWHGSEGQDGQHELWIWCGLIW